MATETASKLSSTSTVVACAVFCACGGSVRTVPTGPHPVAGAVVDVDVAPPPAKVEQLPPDPGEPCAWVDGRWDWRGRGWEWIPGDWVVPMNGCYYAPPLAIWADTFGRGNLSYRPGSWYASGGAATCPEPRSCTQ